jgi:hypothetical protein
MKKNIFAILSTIINFRCDAPFIIETFIGLFTFHVSLFTYCTASNLDQYPGDYEIWLANQMENRRTTEEHSRILKVDNHYVLMDFHKIVD